MKKLVPVCECEQAGTFFLYQVVVAVADFHETREKIGRNGAVPQPVGDRDDGRLVHVLAFGEGADEFLYESRRFHSGVKIGRFSHAAKLLQVLQKLQGPTN